MAPTVRPRASEMDKDFIFVGNATPSRGSVREVYGFWRDHKIVKVRIDSFDRSLVTGIAITEVEDCCDVDDRYLELEFHGVLHNGYIRSIVVDTEVEHNPEK